MTIANPRNQPRPTLHDLGIMTHQTNKATFPLNVLRKFHGNRAMGVKEGAFVFVQKRKKNENLACCCATTQDGVTAPHELRFVSLGQNLTDLKQGEVAR